MCGCACLGGVRCVCVGMVLRLFCLTELAQEIFEMQREEKKAAELKRERKNERKDESPSKSALSLSLATPPPCLRKRHVCTPRLQIEIEHTDRQVGGTGESKHVADIKICMPTEYIFLVVMHVYRWIYTCRDTNAHPLLLSADSLVLLARRKCLHAHAMSSSSLRPHSRKEMRRGRVPEKGRNRRESLPEEKEGVRRMRTYVWLCARMDTVGEEKEASVARACIPVHLEAQVSSDGE